MCIIFIPLYVDDKTKAQETEWLSLYYVDVLAGTQIETPEANSKLPRSRQTLRRVPLNV